MKIDKTVIKETVYIAVFVLAFSIIMQAIYLCLGYWDYTILLGNLWGAILAVVNHFVMGLFIQKAISKADPDEAKKVIKNSMSMRFAALLLLMIIGMVIPIFNPIAVAIPLIFPSLAIYLRPLVDKINSK